MKKVCYTHEKGVLVPLCLFCFLLFPFLFPMPPPPVSLIHTFSLSPLPPPPPPPPLSLNIGIMYRLHCGRHEPGSARSSSAQLTQARELETTKTSRDDDEARFAIDTRIPNAHAKQVVVNIRIFIPTGGTP